MVGHWSRQNIDDVKLYTWYSELCPGPVACCVDVYACSSMLLIECEW
jgi:hypothetical protein